MFKRNAFAVSYGLIVLTNDKKIVLIQRKIPYCVQNFLMKNRSYNINNYREAFIKNSFKTLSLNMKFDYINFLCESEFEDQFDLPHGQMQFNTITAKRIIQKMKNNSNLNKNYLKFHAFMTALREFKEETGYSFKFCQNISELPTRTIDFVGLDECFYTQTYFIVTIEKLEKCKDLKGDHFYEPTIIDLKKGVELFKRQQRIKCDGKDKILSQLL